MVITEDHVLCHPRSVAAVYVPTPIFSLMPLVKAGSIRRCVPAGADLTPSTGKTGGMPVCTRRGNACGAGVRTVPAVDGAACTETGNGDRSIHEGRSNLTMFSISNILK